MANYCKIIKYEIEPKKGPDSNRSHNFESISEKIGAAMWLPLPRGSNPKGRALSSSGCPHWPLVTLATVPGFPAWSPLGHSRLLNLASPSSGAEGAKIMALGQFSKTQEFLLNMCGEKYGYSQGEYWWRRWPPLWTMMTSTMPPHCRLHRQDEIMTKTIPARRMDESSQGQRRSRSRSRSSSSGDPTKSKQALKTPPPNM